MDVAKLTALGAVFLTMGCSSGSAPLEPTSTKTERLDLFVTDEVAAPDATATSFGWSVDADSFDNLEVFAAVGAPAQSRAWGVFTFFGNTWYPQEFGRSSGASDDSFGWSVAVSRRLVAIGAPHYDQSTTPNAGRVYVFEVEGTSTYTELAPIDPPQARSNGEFGYALDLDADTLVVGHQISNAAGADMGEATVYRFVNSSWVLEQQLFPSPLVQGEKFGVAVAIDGDTIAVGAPRWDGTGFDSGSVFVYTRSGSTWGLQQRLDSGESASELSGTAVDLNGDLLIAGSLSQGAVVYGRSGTSWTRQQRLPGDSTSAGDGAGSAVAIGRGVAMVAAPARTHTAGSQGSVAVYVESGGTWLDTAHLYGAAASDLLGSSIAPLGNRLLAGKSGAVAIFEIAGQGCSTAAECVVGQCRNGICCNASCAGACETCSSAEGSTTDGYCAYRLATDLGSPSCAPYVCSGTDPACPTSCNDDLLCDSAHYCDGSACVADLANGAACDRDEQCQTGFCTDGFCCDLRCAGDCEACSTALKGAGADGACEPVVSGTDPDGDCDPDVNFPTSCLGDGLCDGAGACRTVAPVGTVCGSSACAAPATFSQFECNGAGSCVSRVSSCEPYKCASATACATSCSTSADCVTGFCDAGSCAPKKVLGATCSDGSECASGNCADGVCCDTACAGTCKACSAVAKGYGGDGTCDPVRSGTDPRDDCPEEPATSCGFDGTCNGNGVCRQHPAGTACGATECVGNLARGQICDGVGSCVNDATGVDCAPGACSAGGCTTNCTTSADCATDAFCDSGTCVRQLDNGEACQASSDCESGFCIDSVCCNVACAGQCEACDSAGFEGVCVPIQGAPHGARTPCFDDGSSCSGTCDGVNTSCSYPAAGALCGTASCAGGVASSYACNGQGTCEQTQDKCGAYACSGSECATTCASDDDCSTGYGCNAGSCVPTSGAQCSDDLTESVGNDNTSACVPYLCDPAAGTCRVACSTTAECATGHVCDDALKRCIAESAEASDAEEGGCGCRTPGLPAQQGKWPLAALGLLMLLRRRSNRPRHRRSATPEP